MDTQVPTARRRSRHLPAAGRLTWRAVLVLCLPALALTAQGAFAAEPAPPAPAEATRETEAAEVNFVDVGFTPNPLPGTDIILTYRFERDRDQTESGNVISYAHGVSVNLDWAITDWLGVSLGIPYQITDVRTTDPATGAPAEPDTRNLGDMTLASQVVFYKNPAWQLAIGGALALGLPTGSIHDGTGGQWSLKPSLIVGKWLGPVQMLADIGFGWDLRRLSETEERGRELTYDVAVAYPLLDQRLIPFLELNGVYVTQGDPALKHRGQLYLSPGFRVFPFRDASADTEVGRVPGKSEPPWWHDLSLVVGMQFPVTASRAFEWGITTAVKVDF